MRCWPHSRLHYKQNRLSVDFGFAAVESSDYQRLVSYLSSYPYSWEPLLVLGSHPLINVQCPASKTRWAIEEDRMFNLILMESSN